MKFTERKLKIGLLVVFYGLIGMASGTMSGAAPADYPANSLIQVLGYHRIEDTPTSELDITPAQLEEQLRFFRGNGYHPMTAEELVEAREKPWLLPQKPLVLTFDDGLKCHYTKAFPLLKKYHWPATFFVYTGVIAEKSDTQLTWSELQEMAAAGMDIQSHTVSHPFLQKTDLAQDGNYLGWLRHELVDSKEILKKRLNRPVNLLAYPYGCSNRVVDTYALGFGYKGIFTVNFGTNRLNPDQTRYNRMVLSNDMSLDLIYSLLTVKPLEIEALTPEDGTIVYGVSKLRFRIKNAHFDQVEVKFAGKRGIVKADKKGVFTFRDIPKLDPGYKMVIVKTHTAPNDNYLGSWGFEYQSQLGEDTNADDSRNGYPDDD